VNRAARIVATAIALLVSMPAMGAATPLPPVRVDHHMHVHSPAILGFLPDYCSSSGRIGKCDPEFLKPYTVNDALAEMDKAGVRRGVLLSTAYLAESPMMQPPRADAADILRAANDWTVKVARTHPDRLAAFIGVNPITATAVPEIARWKGDPAVTGVKIHVTNSGVDLRNPDDIRKLAGVFRAAAASRLAIVIHMRTRAKDYGAQDVRIFLRDVLPAAGDTTVQIAHSGGWGGLDANTLDALGAFADAIEARPALRRHLFFDLAAVWDDKSSAADKARFVTLIRRIGLRQFLPASDWPFRHDLADYYGRNYPSLPLSDDEWAVIRSNVAPYLGKH
jgi:predicted TIM-barrel fold metal-dependent hydrolase